MKAFPVNADAVLRRRCRLMLNDHRRRAAADFQVIDYTVEDLAQLVTGHPACTYCGCLLTPGTFSLDHAVPTSRRPDYSLSNLRPACILCQERKGCLTADEYKELLALISTWPPRAGSDLLARLRTGTARYSSSLNALDEAGQAIRDKANDRKAQQLDALAVAKTLVALDAAVRKLNKLAEDLKPDLFEDKESA